jgi:hypothetical protein
LPSREKAERSEKNKAIRFLEDLLKDGPVGSQVVIDAASQAGIAEKTLKRAKKQMGITSKKDSSYMGGWVWELTVPDNGQGVKEVSEEGQLLKRASEGGHTNKNGLLQ